MFSRLVASQGGQSQFRRPAAIVASVAAHAALLAGIVWASAPAAEDLSTEVLPEEVVTFIDIAEAPPPDMVFDEPVAEPQPAAAPPPVAVRTPRPVRQAQPRTPAPSAPSAVAEPAGFQELRTPPIVTGIPPVDPGAVAVNPADFGGRGTAGGTAGGTPAPPGGSGAPAVAAGTGTGGTGGSPTGTFSATMVDRTASLLNRSEIVQQLQRLYPRMLSEARIEGVVQVQFVVTAEGRVDMSTVEVVSASNDQFRDATLRVLREFRFRPARKGEHNVRMLTTIPINWKLEK